MGEKQDKLDKLFKGYYKSKRVPIISSPSLETACCKPCFAPRPTDYKVTKEPCPELRTISSYIEGVLDETGRGVIESHIKSCKKCRDNAESGSLAMRTLNADRLEKIPENISSDISSKLSNYLRKNTPPKEKKEIL